MSSILQSLTKFGLTVNQTNIYLVLLELGEAKVQDIAKRAKILRSTTYEVLEQLKTIGLVSLYHLRGVRMYMAEPPRVLESILETKQQSIKEILPELESIYNRGGFKPKIRYYEGLEGYRIVYENTLTAKEKQLHGILSMQDMLEKLGEEYMDNYIRQRVEKKIYLQVIRISPYEIKPIWPTAHEELRTVRLAPQGFNFPLTMYIYDNKVSLMSTKRENFSLIIESHEFMQTQKALFNILWQASGEAK